MTIEVCEFVSVAIDLTVPLVSWEKSYQENEGDCKAPMH
jgi:hypothetical protein